MLTSSLFKYAFALLFVGAAAPFAALTTPTADPVPPALVGVPTVIPLPKVVPVGGGVPGTVGDEEDMPARGFWSRDRMDCCRLVGSTALPVEGVTLPVPGT